MSLLFWDTFDHYATGDVLEKYTSWIGGNVTTGAFGRDGTNGMKIIGASNGDDWVRGPLAGDPDTITMGFGFQVEYVLASGHRTIMGFLDGASDQITLNLVTDGSLRLYRGDRVFLLGQSDPGTIHQGVYYYIEVQVHIDNAAGTGEVRVNDEVVIDVAGVDTQMTANAYATQFMLGGDGLDTLSTLLMWFDDLYVLDDSGAQCNDFLGDIHNYLLMPEGAGAHADWTPLVGANWQEVDDNPPDDDTTYNATNTVTDRDSFEMEDMPGGWTGTIHAVGVAINSRRDDAVAHELQPAVRSGGTDYDGTAALITDAYSFYNLYAWELDPDTAAAWLVAAVNAMECGYELTV